ncbi:ZIP zinc transporter-domain-containing protein [Apiospora arundinis]
MRYGFHAAFEQQWTFFNSEACKFIWQQVIRGPVTHLVAPAKAAIYEFAGLPPTAAYVGDMDPLHDEVVHFMEAAQRKDFLCKTVEGVPYGFDAMLPGEVISEEVKAWMLKWMRGRFGMAELLAPACPNPTASSAER